VKLRERLTRRLDTTIRDPMLMFASSTISEPPRREGFVAGTGGKLTLGFH
jgi:hypothetical protein